MRLHRFSDVAAFLDRVGPFLLAREAEHSLMLGILTGLEAGRRYDGAPLLAAVQHANEVVAAALRTPPYNLVLSLAQPPALACLAGGLADEDLPGVNGPRAEAAGFARRYAAARGVHPTEGMALALYRLQEVVEPAPVEGAYRALAERDRATAIPFLAAFHQEARVHATSDPSWLFDQALRAGTRGMAVWEADGEIASLAGWSRATPGSSRIGPVYTPPERRGRGYASALVARLSRQLLERGAHFCTLYTDLANPTSNGVYRRIGYRRVMEAVEIGFEPGS